MNASDKLLYLSKDLTKDSPRSPREIFAGFVIAARCLDKCRSVLADCAGEYHSGCPLDMIFLDFVGISYEDFKEFVATGANDDEVAAWLTLHAQQRPRIEVIRWNNEWRGKRIVELPDELQEFMEDYVPKFVPKNRPVYTFFDIYDLEEERI